MSFKFRYIFIFFVIASSLQSFAQVNDAALWLSFSAEKKISPVLTATLSEEFRFSENISELGTFFTDLGIGYKINNIVRISGNYRFTNKRQVDDFYSKRHRYYFDLTIREKIKPLILQFRTRFQSQYTDMFSSDEGKIPSYYSRNKLTVKLDLDKKYSPYIYTELFSPLTNPNGNLIDNARYSAGIDYSINRIHSLCFFYMIQREYNVNNPQTDYITGIEYKITF